jgi:hypothetical protein
MKKGLRQLISDDKGIVSSKRVVAILCVLILCLFFILQGCGVIEREFDVHLLDALVYIAMVCLFGTSVEKISFGKKNENT